jgi:hypothetical protein
MQGGFRRSRYSSDKFEQIKAEAARDAKDSGEKRPTQRELQDPVQPIADQPPTKGLSDLLPSW